jgi:hypothetical protein
MTKGSKTCISVQAPLKINFPESALKSGTENREKRMIKSMMMSMLMKNLKPKEIDKKDMIFLK